MPREQTAREVALQSAQQEMEARLQQLQDRATNSAGELTASRSAGTPPRDCCVESPKHCWRQGLHPPYVCEQILR